MLKLEEILARLKALATESTEKSEEQFNWFDEETEGEERYEENEKAAVPDDDADAQPEPDNGRRG